MPVTCQVERFADVAHEIARLVDPQWEEVGSYKEHFRREVDYVAYQQLADMGRLITVSARDETGLLVGYIVGAIGGDFHRVTLDDPPRRAGVCSYLAYYILPEKRGYARALIRTIENAAVAKGVQILNTRVKPGRNDADKFFRMIGYSDTEVVMTKLIG